MFFKNYGPIDKLELDMPFDSDGNPQPVILVGENGSGKTIVLSSVVDSLFELLNKLFTNILIQSSSGHKFYKLKGDINRNILKSYCMCGLQYNSQIVGNIEYIDVVGTPVDEEIAYFRQNYLSDPFIKATEKIRTDLNENQNHNLKMDLLQGSYFYLPAYRFEKPFWKNDLYYDISELEKPNYANIYNKPIEIINSFSDNFVFLLDIILDDLAYGYHTETFDFINKMLSLLKSTPNIILRLAPRKNGSRLYLDRIDLQKRNILVLDNLNKLSLGESILLNLFLNILRLQDKTTLSINSIEGIVVIDEVDVHLHINLQRNVLPELIKMFPKVQFILTTHSPMFLLGMEETFRSDKYKIIEMPNGNQISCERFSEFQNAYSIISETKTFEDGLNKLIEKESKPIVFVEGIYDIEYITCAAKELSEEKLLNGIVLKYAGGFPNLNKIDKHFECQTLREILKQRILLLYDCDLLTANEKKHDKTMGSVFRRTIPPISSNKIKKGIENLFPNEVIDDAIKYNIAFIDHKAGRANIIEGNNVDEPEEFSINENQKRNFCDWIRTTKNNPYAFINFTKIFDIIKDFLQLTATSQQPPTASQESHSES